MDDSFGNHQQGSIIGPTVVGRIDGIALFPPFGMLIMGLASGGR
jgi:hypothetical protein